jgi:hypothetical protein
VPSFYKWTPQEWAEKKDCTLSNQPNLGAMRVASLTCFAHPMFHAAGVHGFCFISIKSVIVLGQLPPDALCGCTRLGARRQQEQRCTRLLVSCRYGLCVSRNTPEHFASGKNSELADRWIGASSIVPANNLRFAVCCHMSLCNLIGGKGKAKPQV